MICDICGFPITGSMIGNGDGTGDRFAHPDCYWKSQYLIKCDDYAKLQQEYLKSLQNINKGLSTMNEIQSINRLSREEIDVVLTKLEDSIKGYKK